MKKKHFIISSIAAMLLLACGNNYNKNFILENQDYKIWQVKRDSINEYCINSYYYFDDKFNCYNILIDYHTGRFERFYYDDVIMEHKWAINGDTLFIEMFPYLILGQDNDTIYLEYIFRNSAYGRKVFLIDIGIPPK